MDTSWASQSPGKSVVNLTKKSYREICEHITRHTDPEQAQTTIALMTAAMRETTSFDPVAKQSLEMSRRQNEIRKEKLKASGATYYDAFNKKRYERLRAQFPNVPASVLIKTPIKDLPALNASLNANVNH